ncbi:MAG: hypothetical protein ACD_79C00765G0004 [uncultured bacterium]|nr:MAG: hypothetical protein ACD_79C00765G0004 [uncultured bacterium]
MTEQIQTTKLNVFFFVSVMLLIIGASAFMWLKYPAPEIIVSLALRLFSTFFAFYLLFKFQEWRIIFIGLMFIMMTIHQVFTFLLQSKIIESTPTHTTFSEIPALILTIFSFASVIYLGIILKNQTEVLNKHKTKIEMLESFLPICSHCKKIRTDNNTPEDPNSWIAVETYFNIKNQVEFSHGICPDCLGKYYSNDKKSEIH